jgi:mycobactin peptide synthetase MbtE
MTVAAGDRARAARAFQDHVNATRRDYPRDATIHVLFTDQAARTPDRAAVLDGSSALTYRELDERSARLAGVIREHHVGTGDMVALRVRRGLSWVIGTLAILRAGAAYVPIDPRHPTRRAEYVLGDCGARLLLVAGDEDRLAGITCLDVNAVGCSKAPAPTDVAATSPAYVMYTSGTTGEPKGVVVGHRSVARLVVGTDYVDFSSPLRLLQTGAITFDATTFELWGTLLHGGQLVIAHDDVIVDGTRMRAALAGHLITTMWLTSPLFSQLTRSDPSMFAPLRDLVVGGDVVVGEHVAAVLRACPGLRITNGYGPTENTTFSTTHTITLADVAGSVPIGRPIANSTAYVLDTHRQPLGPEDEGELYVGGDGVALGYLRRPSLTDGAFVADPFVGGQSRMYRTGDRARWRADGTLEFLGRVDDQTKIRGQRVEPREIEHVLRRHEGVGEAAVVVRQRDGDGPHERHLVGYVVPAGRLDLRELRQFLAERLPEQLIPGHLIMLGGLPLGLHGKLDREQLPDPDQPPGTGDHHVGPRDHLEQFLAGLCERLLGTAPVGVLDDFYEIGLDSMLAGVLAGQLNAACAANVGASDVLRAANVEELARLLTERSAVALPPAATLQRDSEFTAGDADPGPAPSAVLQSCVLSPQQRRLLAEQGKDERSVRYNVPIVVELGVDVDVERLRLAFERLSERHEILRADFGFDGQLIQRVRPDARIRLEARDGAPVLTELVRPFDLGVAPLVRASIHGDGQRRWLFVDSHHIITDGWSLALMFQELDLLYAGQSLPPVSHQYRDHCRWLAGEQAKPLLERQRRYWAGIFAEPQPIGDLPTDRPRPPIGSGRGAALSFDLGHPRSAALRALAGRHGVTVFSALAAVYAALLSAVTGWEDVTIGVPAAGRARPGMDRVLGMFANTLCLRLRPKPGQRFSEFLGEVSQRAGEALAHQDYSFDELIEELAPPRDFSRNPLFDTMLALHSASLLEMPFLGRRVRLRPQFTGESMFDLNLQVYETGAGLDGEWQYTTDLFDAATIAGLQAALEQIMDRAITDSNLTMGHLAAVAAPAPMPAVEPPTLEFDL